MAKTISSNGKRKVVHPNDVSAVEPNGAPAVEPNEALEVETLGDVVAPVEEHKEHINPWAALRVVIVDDAMHAPLCSNLDGEEVESVENFLKSDPEVISELAAIGCEADASADKKLLAFANAKTPLESIARLALLSKDAQRMVEEHRSFLNLRQALEVEVAEIKVCDPYKDLTDLTTYDLVLLDYYLDGSANGGERAIRIASMIRSQSGRREDQQIVLMSSLETVSELRKEFRAESNLIGSAFAFVGKPDLNEPWKVKAHLGMLERARPYAPAFTHYRTRLDEALGQARDDLLALVDDLDIGDYAFLQGRALMKDGHPLGDYVFWLLSSQLMALTFEGDEMRARQRSLDVLEFVGEPFSATEPSVVVANLLHSALVSRQVGPLGPHPRARSDEEYRHFPLVQLGDVFLDEARTKAVAVMSADCDLAFSPMNDRPPDRETPVMLVPGTPIKLREAKEENNPRTDGILHRNEVYRIGWDFAKYRSVELGSLEAWLKNEGLDISNRDRLRPLFGLKLQQEFGAHLLRVGPPLLPPMTTPVTGRIYVCQSDRLEVRELGPKELMLTRFKDTTLLRVTPNVAGALKTACEELLSILDEQLTSAKGKEKVSLTKKIDSLSGQIANDQFWIELLRGIELNSKGSVKTQGPLGIVLGMEWADGGKPRVVLQLEEDIQSSAVSDAAALPLGQEAEIDAVSGAG